MQRTLFLVVVLLFGAQGCTNCSQQNNASEEELSQEVLEKSSVFNIRNSLFSIPSPHQLTKMLADKKMAYQPSHLNPLANYKNYQSSFKKALNLGIYGANFGYLNLYDKTQETIKYFSVIKILAEDLKVISAIKEDVLKKIESNLSNKDTLLYYITNSFQDIDIHLKVNQQESIGALILAGGWIESMYLLAEYAKNTKDPELYARIGENRKALENLLAILNEHSEETPGYEKLIEKLSSLSQTFSQVETRYRYVKSEHATAQKFSKIEIISEVSMPEPLFAEIYSQITELRNFCIN